MIFLIYGIPVYILISIICFVISGRISVYTVAINHYKKLRISGVVLGFVAYHLTKYLFSSFYKMHVSPVLFLLNRSYQLFYLE